MCGKICDVYSNKALLLRDLKYKFTTVQNRIDLARVVYFRVFTLWARKLFALMY